MDIAKIFSIRSYQETQLCVHSSEYASGTLPSTTFRKQLFAQLTLVKASSDAGTKAAF